MPAAPEQPPILDAAHAAFIRGAVAISVAAADERNLPTLVRAMGCRLSEDRRRVTVFLAVSQSVAVLAAVMRTGRIAVVFTEPHTHRTIQLKGEDAALCPLGADDFALIETHTDALVGELGPLGYTAAFVRAAFHCDAEDAGAIVFTVSAAFAQTPGPHAGAKLATLPS